MEHSYVSVNRFASLSNLNDNQQEEMEYTHKCELPQSTQILTRTTSQHNQGSKIATIVNGRINHSVHKEPLKKTSNQLRTLKRRSTTKTIHKVKIIGDNHLKGSATRLNQYPNTKFEICSLIKSGARTDQLVLSQEKELKCLGKNYVIVINGGAKDIDKPNGKENGILALMIHFMQKYKNTNIIIGNIPHRHDLASVAKTNFFCIQVYNSKTKKYFEAIQTCFSG